MKVNRLENVAVIGAGIMGHALALVHAIGGCRVRLQDVDAAALEKAPALIDAALTTLIEAGGIPSGERAAINARVALAPKLADAVQGVDLVVEAIVEDRDVKREVFAQIDEAAPRDAIIASNTSYLDVFPLVPAARQSHTLVAHWYTPPYILDLVDIASGPETEPGVIEAIKDLYIGFGKKPVLFETLIPGYIANRLQAAISLEAYRMLDEGWVSVEAIDDSIRHGLASRLALLGHLQKADFTGLELVRRGLANRMYTPPEPKGGSETIDRLVSEGRTGVMAGAGFYDYGDRPPAELFRERDRKLLKLKQLITDLDESSC